MCLGNWAAEHELNMMSDNEKDYKKLYEDQRDENRYLRERLERLEKLEEFYDMVGLGLSNNDLLEELYSLHCIHVEGE